MKTDEELRRGIIEDEACEEAYIAACEEVGPNSPEFDRVYDDHYEKEMERMSDSKSDGYEKLWEVLKRAGEQASLGKGKERHSETQGVFRPFHEQPICSIGRMVGTGYNIGQGMKKGHEARELPQERAVDELLGAINYFASAVILMEEQEPEQFVGLGAKVGAAPDDSMFVYQPEDWPTSVSLTATHL